MSLFAVAHVFPGWCGGVWGLGEPAVCSDPRDCELNEKEMSKF